VNVKDATRLIKTGDIVTLDAEKGIITIEKEK
jgi:phosphohistidine swiveling domain-containing protein